MQDVLVRILDWTILNSTDKNAIPETVFRFYVKT